MQILKRFTRAKYYTTTYFIYYSKYEIYSGTYFVINRTLQAVYNTYYIPDSSYKQTNCLRKAIKYSQLGKI